MICPSGKKIIPKNPDKNPINIARGTKPKTMTLARGEIREIFPKLEIIIGIVNIWAAKVADNISRKNPGIFLNQISNMGVR